MAQVPRQRRERPRSRSHQQPRQGDNQNELEDATQVRSLVTRMLPQVLGLRKNKKPAVPSQVVAPLLRLKIHYDEGLMATYLITGIAGFIGSALARAALAQGDQVRGIDNLSTGKRENLTEILPRIDFRQADLLDLASTHDACRGVDYVLNEAAIPSVPKSVLDPLGSNQANVDATVNLLVAARDAKVKPFP